MPPTATPSCLVYPPLDPSAFPSPLSPSQQRALTRTSTDRPPYGIRARPEQISHANESTPRRNEHRHRRHQSTTAVPTKERTRGGKAARFPSRPAPHNNPGHPTTPQAHEASCRVGGGGGGGEGTSAAEKARRRRPGCGRRRMSSG